jgi:deoxyribonuclease-4
MNTRPIGLHTSIAGGLHKALERAGALGCNTMQIFSHNPRGWKVNEVSDEEVKLFRSLKTELDITPVYIHTSYLLNIASPKDDLRAKSIAMLRFEMQRADIIGAQYVVMHTGTAHDEDGFKRAAASIKEAFREGSFSSGLLLENTSGKRGDIASSVADLEVLLDAAGGLPAGVCIDTCHAYAAGYDLSQTAGVERLASEVQSKLGSDAVKLIHLNDSKGLMDSGTDRHEHIGQGLIGADGLGMFLNHDVFREIPIVLETPRTTDQDDLDNLSRARALLR